jgi:hypothetical protein
MHAAERTFATDMPTAGTCDEAAATHPAATSMTTTALRPHGHGQYQRKRRDGCQATHTTLLL